MICAVANLPAQRSALLASISGLVLLLFGVTFVSTPTIVFAQSNNERGEIAVLSAQLRPTSVGWELLATADIELSPSMRQGLNSGVPLQFIVEFSIKRVRPFWLDKILLEQQHQYSLIYYELTRHYRLQSLDTSQSGNYRSLLAALDELGQLKGVEVLRPDDFDDSGELFGHISIRLDDRALPLPLQPLLSSKWKLASEDFAWSLN